MAESYPKPVENTVGKGEIARYEQFLLYQQCFQKACFPGASKDIFVWEWVKYSEIMLGNIYHRNTANPSHQVLNCRLQTLSVWKSLKFVIREGVNWYNAPWPCNRRPFQMTRLIYLLASYLSNKRFFHLCLFYMYFCFVISKVI